MDGNMKYVFVCKNCGTVGSAFSKCFCTKCDADMTPAPYNPVQWNAVSPEARNRVIEHWMKTSVWPDIAGVEKLKTPPVSKPYDMGTVTASTGFGNPAASTGWVNLLRTFAYIGLVLGIAASLIGGIVLMSQSSVLGIVVLLLGCLFSFLGISGIMIFLDLASDVRTIRKLVEKNEK